MLTVELIKAMICAKAVHALDDIIEGDGFYLVPKDKPSAADSICYSASIKDMCTVKSKLVSFEKAYELRLKQFYKLNSMNRQNKVILGVSFTGMEEQFTSVEDIIAIMQAVLKKVNIEACKYIAGEIYKQWDGTRTHLDTLDNDIRKEYLNYRKCNPEAINDATVGLSLKVMVF